MPITANTFNHNKISPFLPDSGEVMSIAIKASQTIAKGTLMAQNSSTGLWEAYVNAGANGVGTARGVLMYDVKTDANGLATLGDATPGEWGHGLKTVPMYFAGAFRKGDLGANLDAGAITNLGARYITGGTTAADDILLIPS